MGWMNGARVRLRQLLWRRTAEERIDEEIRFHLEMETAKHVRGGMNPEEARRRAVLAFGGMETHRAELRMGWQVPLVEDLARDIRYAARSLRRSAGFTVVAVLILALGIGAGTAMFSVLDAVLLRELPVREQDELVVLWTASATGGSDHLPVMQGERLAFREGTRTFASIAGVAYQGAAEAILRDGAEALGVAGTWVTGEFFPTLGVRPIQGRALEPADDLPGAEPVMVIGHGFWQRHFGGDPAAVGRRLEWNGVRYTVVGVLPRGFEYPRRAEFWVPVFAAFPEEALKSSSGFVIFDLVGRLRPGAGLAEARTEYEAFLRAGDPERPAALRGMRAVVTPFPQQITGEVRPTLRLAAVAVALLLLIACVNVANLLLIRGTARGQELAIRSALGAGRQRLMRQLLTESGVLALWGGVFGCMLAFAAVRLLVRLAPPGLPLRETIALDGRALLFALAVTVAAALLAGLLPAVLSARGDLSVRLRAGRGTSAAGRGAQALRHGLVIVQVSLAILVVVGAGLLGRSLIALQQLDMGFNEEQLLVARTVLPPGAFAERTQLVALHEEMLARVAALPGVVGATLVPSHPFSELGGWTAQFTGEGQAPDAQATNPWVNFEVVGPEYFRTLELPIRRGRAFAEQDREDAPRVAIISEAVARHTWPGEDPVGRRVKLGPPDGPGEWHTVVGVVGETRYRALTDPQPSLYLPIRQFGGPVPGGLAIRTRAESAAVIPQVRSVLQEQHPDWLLVSGGSVRELLAAPLARPRFSTLLLGAFGAMTLLLATVGIYGAIAATVRQRTREIGIRLAVGARPAAVQGAVLRQGLGLACWGCVLGIAGALAAGRVIEGMLFGIGPADPVTLAGVAALILGAAALASFLPARHASRVDPMTTLRAE